MEKHKRIFIIGHSGAGKRELGAAVAKKLGWKHMNTDFALAVSIGRHLNEVFGEEGAKSFYQCLAQILSYQCHKENIVVSVDGSLICDASSQELLSKEFTVHLKVTSLTQMDRLSHHYPLLPLANYQEFLDLFHQERDPLYQKVSTIAIDSDTSPLDEQVSILIQAFEK